MFQDFWQRLYVDLTPTVHTDRMEATADRNVPSPSPMEEGDIPINSVQCQYIDNSDSGSCSNTGLESGSQTGEEESTANVEDPRPD